MRYAPWAASWFCAVLSVITIVADLALSVVNHQPDKLGPATAFLAFQPMCSFFLALQVSNQQREIADLRGQVETLKTKHAS
jgi:hypothetical protein